MDKIQYMSGWDMLDCFAEMVCSHKNSIWVAHNARSYDAVLLRPALERMAGMKLDVVRNGQKLMLMSIPRLKIKFYDSLNHIQDRLCNLPKTFWFNVKLLEGKRIDLARAVFRTFKSVLRGRTILRFPTLS